MKNTKNESKFLPRYYVKTKKSIIELIIQVIFLILIISLENVYYGNRHKSTLGDKLKQTFIGKQFKSTANKGYINYKRIMTHQDVHNYLRKVFIKLVSIDFTSKTFNHNKTNILINFQNYLIGVPRIFMKNVKNIDCAEFFSNYLANFHKNNTGFKCSPNWKSEYDKNDDLELNKTLLKSLLENNNSSKISVNSKKIVLEKIQNAFKHINSSSMNKWCTVIGKLNRYDCGGYYVDLFRTHDENLLLLNLLRELNWISLKTRLISIQFNLYNPSNKFTTTIELLIEFKNSGGAIVNYRMNIMYLPLSYKKCCSYKDAKMLLITLAIFCFSLLYSYESWKNFAFFGLNYFKNLWNLLDLFCVIILYIYLYSRMFLILHNSEKVLDFKYANSYYDLIYISMVFEIKYYSLSVLIFLATIRLLKFITFNTTLNYLVSTFKKCATDLIGLCITTGVVLISYSIILNLQYGASHWDYTSLIRCLVSLFRIFWGDFKFDELHNQHPLFTLIVHFTYIYIVYYFLINMILVIIVDTYSSVKADESNQSSQLHFFEFLRIFLMINLKKYSITNWILNNIFEKLPVKLYCVEDVERELRRRGFNDIDINMFYAKYAFEQSSQIDEHLLKDVIYSMMQTTGKLYDQNLISEKKLKFMKKYCPSKTYSMFNYDIQTTNNFLSFVDTKISIIDELLNNLILTNKNQSSDLKYEDNSAKSD